jgi:ribosome modulation factor
MNDTNELLPHIKLRFNIEHPNFEECYAHGYESALADKGEEENPYREGTRESEQWLEGWWAGFYGEKPLFELDEQTETEQEQEQEQKQQQKQQQEAANDQSYHFISGFVSSTFLINILKITGAIAATAVVGYQVFELVA